MKIRSPLLTKLIVWLGASVLRLLFRTLKFEFRLAVPERTPIFCTGSERFLVPIWHDSLIIAAFYPMAPRNTVNLVSRHQDGSFLAYALEHLGFSTVRGSTSRGGAQAVRQLLEAASDQHIVITPDGPRGPRREMKMGIVYLASQTGRAIVPSAFACERQWTIKGRWTDMAVPKPFSRVFVFGGEPISVPPDLSRDELERYRRQLQDAMDALDADAQRLIATGAEPASDNRKAAA